MLGRDTVDETEVAATLLLRTSELLGEPDLDLSGNFLDVGGHSLMAFQLSSTIEAHFGVPVDLRLLFGESLTAVAQDIVIRMTSERPSQCSKSVRGAS